MLQCATECKLIFIQLLALATPVEFFRCSSRFAPLPLLSYATYEGQESKSYVIDTIKSLRPCSDIDGFHASSGHALRLSLYD